MKVVVHIINGILVLLLTAALPQAVAAQSAIFDTNRACQSPHGDVEESCKAYSPNGRFYAQVVQPGNGKSGHILVFEVSKSKPDKKLSEIRILGEESNPIKGLAWAPDNRRLAVMYHHGNPRQKPGYVTIVDAKTEQRLRQEIRIKAWHHFTVWDSTQNGTQLRLSEYGGQIDERIDNP